MIYEYILFDADDTLYDYALAEAHALTSAFQEFGIEDTDNSYVDRYRIINQGLWTEFEQGKISSVNLRRERFARLFAADSVHASIDADNLSARYLNYLGEGSFLLEGAEALVKGLLGKYRLAIITNGIKEVQMARIGKSGLLDSFEHIIVSEDTGFQKPHVGIFDYTFNKLNIVDKSKVLIVGDSLTSDIQGGINYGIDTCWFNPKNKTNTTGIQPTYEVHSYGELLTII